MCLLLPKVGYTIHNIIEQSTIKTIDTYIKFLTPKDTKDTICCLNSIFKSKYPLYYGYYYVNINLSSQNILLKDLFPI